MEEQNQVVNSILGSTIEKIKKNKVVMAILVAVACAIAYIMAYDVEVEDVIPVDTQIEQVEENVELNDSVQ